MLIAEFKCTLFEQYHFIYSEENDFGSTHLKSNYYNINLLNNVYNFVFIGFILY